MLDVEVMMELSTRPFVATVASVVMIVYLFS